MKIEHKKEIVSFAHIDENSNLFTYYFTLENMNIELHSIDLYKKNSKNGKTYKHEEIYHNKYKPNVYNYDTNEFEEPKIPLDVYNAMKNYKAGYLINENFEHIKIDNPNKN